MATAAARKIIKSVSGSTIRIASGAALSNAFKLEYDDLVGIYMPAAWTAASLGFQVSYDGSTYFPMRDAANAVVNITLTVAAGQFVKLPTNYVTGGLWVKLWSNTAGADTNQAADRDLVLVTQPIDAGG